MFIGTLGSSLIGKLNSAVGQSGILESSARGLRFFPFLPRKPPYQRLSRFRLHHEHSGFAACDEAGPDSAAM